MNFGKAKKILIFLFLFLNLFLIYQLVQISDASTRLNPDSVQKTIALLQKQNITASEKNILRNIEILDYLELYNPLSNMEETTKKIHPNIQKTENSFFLSLNLPLEKTDEKEILRKIRQSGFKDYTFLFSYTIENPVTGEKKFLFNQTYNGYTIDGAQIYASVKNNILESVAGNIYDIANVKYTDYQIISPLQILLDISANYTGSGAELNAMRQAYYIPQEHRTYQNLTAIPCYIIHLSGHHLYYDAVTGDFLFMRSKDGFVFSEKQQAFAAIS